MQEVLPMLHDKNELNNEIIEQISGGGGYTRLRDPIQAANPTQEADPMQEVAVHTIALPSAGTMEDFYNFRNSGNQDSVLEQCIGSHYSNCEPGLLKTEIPTGDIQATIPSNNKNAFKIH